MRDISTIRHQAADRIQSLIDEAYEAGIAAGRQEAAVEFKSRISALLEEDRPTRPASEPAPIKQTTASVQSEGAVRAAQGTVKPTILTLVQSNADGLTTREIAERTGFKPNSVRGTLHNLRQEDAVRRDGNRWKPSRPESAPLPFPSRPEDEAEGKADVADDQLSGR